MPFLSGYEALKVLTDALGLQGVPVNKLVIEASCNGVCTVYVKAFPRDDEVGRVASALKVLSVKDVRAADDGTVTYTPAEESPAYRRGLEDGRRQALEEKAAPVWDATPGG